MSSDDTPQNVPLSSPLSPVFPKPPTPPLPSEPPPPYAVHSSRRSRRTSRRLSLAQQQQQQHLVPGDGEDENSTLLVQPRPRRGQLRVGTSRRSLPAFLQLFAPQSVGVDGEASPLLSPVSSNWYHEERRTFSERVRHYFKPMKQKKYYWPLLHLLAINFFYALAAWLCLFVGVLVGTTLLLTLPFGALIWFLTLLLARAFARGELAIQSYFHRPLSLQPPNPPRPIFPCVAPPAPDTESGSSTISSASRPRSSFIRNTYALFTDPRSYQPIFYFLVIKPSITLALTVFLAIVVPPSFILVIPAPACLRLVKRIGIWQGNIAMEGLA